MDSTSAQPPQPPRQRGKRIRSKKHRVRHRPAPNQRRARNGLPPLSAFPGAESRDEFVKRRQHEGDERAAAKKRKMVRLVECIWEMRRLCADDGDDVGGGEAGRGGCGG